MVFPITSSIDHYSILSGQLKCIVRLKYKEYGVYGDLIMVAVKAIFYLRKRA